MAAVLAAVIGSAPWSCVFVATRLVVASGTAVRRMGAPAGQVPWVALGILAAAGPVLALTLLSEVVPLDGARIVPVAGILIGGARGSPLPWA